MWKKTVFCTLLSMMAGLGSGLAQPPGTVSAQLKAQRAAAQADPMEESYQARIKKSEIDGIYIPKDLGDAFDQLTQLTDQASRDKFKAMSEEDARHKLHFSLGRWIIHNWGFYQGSRLSKYLDDLGVYDPDDMARFIIVTYHRRLNGKPLQENELIAEFQEMRRQERQERLLEGKVIHQETRKRPPGDQ